MDSFKSFTVDPINYGDIQDFQGELQDQNIKYVVRLDSDIPKANFSVFNSGLDLDVFIKQNLSVNETASNYFTGVSLAGDVVYPDFFRRPSTWATSFWYDQEIYNLDLRKVGFDGLFLENSEPTMFCKGECYDETSQFKHKNQLIYSPTN